MSAWKPFLELLEERTVLATFLVTDLGDNGVGNGFQGDLRYCLETANHNAASSNRIVFRPGLAGKITLTQGVLTVTKDLEIDGPSDPGLLTISGDYHSGVFYFPYAAGAEQVSLSDLTITGGTGVDNGFGEFEGGGLMNWQATVTMNRCAIIGNRVGQGATEGFGGGIYNILGTMVLNDCTIADNQAISDTNRGGGGGIDNTSIGHVTLNHCLIARNTAAEFAGGINNTSTMTITDSTIVNNSANSSGGIDTLGTLTMTGSTVAHNTATGTSGGGGGIANSGMATITDCTIMDNTATRFGGGIDTGGLMMLSGSTVSGNFTGGVVSGIGGGIEVVGELHATNCTITGNVATGSAGGIDADISSPVSSFVELTSCTITDNSTPLIGGGLYIANASRVPVRNTIIANNHSNGLGVDVWGTVISLGYNAIGQNTDSVGWVASDRTGDEAHPLDSRLGPLQDNGGPTRTEAPFADSPALSHGDPILAAATDQRGYLRNASHHPTDIGAVQTFPAVKLALLAPAQVGAGQPFELTVVALETHGYTDTTLIGRLHFTSTDPNAVLPKDYDTVPDDAGVHTFSLILQTPGSQIVTVTSLFPELPPVNVTLDVVDSGVPAFSPGTSADLLAAWDLDAWGWHHRRG